MNATPVRDVMTKDVITVRSFAPFRRITATMLSHGIGAVPVVDSIGHAIGLVSRTDLIAKEALAAEGSAELWELLSHRGRQTHARGEATTAARLMSTDLVTVAPETAVSRAAYLMERYAVTHLPVVDHRDMLVGIVSRSDLLRAYLRDDREISGDVSKALSLCVSDEDRATIEVDVEDGVVTLSGVVALRDATHALQHIRALRGVVEVVDKLNRRQDGSDGSDGSDTEDGFNPGPIF